MTEGLDLRTLTPSRLWSRLDPALRQLAARSYFEQARSQPGAAREAEVVLARTLRFREAAVRKLPIDKRATYLARTLQPDDSLAASLLLALHVEHRRPLLSAFLDALEIPHDRGMIAEDHTVTPPPPDRLAAAVETVFGAHPADEVTLYLTALIAMDPDTWGGLRDVLEGRLERPA